MYMVFSSSPRMRFQHILTELGLRYHLRNLGLKDEINGALTRALQWLQILKSENIYPRKAGF